MGERGFDSNNGVNEVTILECRTCLHIMSPDAVLFNIFERWTPPWDGMANTIAEDLEILAQVKVQQSDKHSKVICRTCYELLHSACTFTSMVKRSDQILQQRFPEEQETDTVWPRPIQLDKSINSCMQEESMNVEIKQEVLSDNEYDDSTSVCENGEGFAELDIKVEPEEMIQQQPSEQFTVNGSLTVNTFGTDLTHLTNGSGGENLLTKIKEEPLNEEEIEPAAQGNDLPLSCMLCSKEFNCVTGLKPAHCMVDNIMPQNEEVSSLLQMKGDTSKWQRAKRGRPKKKKRGRPKTSLKSRSEQIREASRKYMQKKKAEALRKAAAGHTVTISEANQKAVATCSDSHSTSVSVDSSSHSEIVKKKNDNYYFHFTTSTDLMVHETCHNKSVCYGCNESFDTFEQLTKHRQTCKAIASQEVKKLKTLDDVLRPQPQEQKAKLECPQCSETFTDVYYLTIHQEIHHSSDSDKLNLQEQSGMEVEALENIFSDNSEF